MEAVERSCRQAGEACEEGDLETAFAAIERCRVWLGREGSIPADDLLLWSSFASRLICSWVLPEQVPVLLRLLWIHPWDAAVHSDLLHCLHYQMDIEPQTLASHHARWARLHGADCPLAPHANDPSPNRRLRIGYVSADFRYHCVAFFLEPLLACHDRGAFEVSGYGNIAPDERDDVTERLEGLFDRYRCVWGMDDRLAAEQIRHDQIDVLVDLGGHTRHNRLPLFALKPAPVQVSYLGYPNTTGLSQMDYRLTDDLADPPAAQPLYTEELVPLGTCFACYRPPHCAPPVSRPPVLSSGRITFGSFVGSVKHNPFLLSLWSDVLKANPQADLLLRFEGAEDPAVQHRNRSAFGRLGIDPHRVRFDGWRAPTDHLAAYDQVDIALDSFPWNSHTTLCEALWMGVPVVSLCGQGFVSSHGTERSQPDGSAGFCGYGAPGVRGQGHGPGSTARRPREDPSLAAAPHGGQSPVRRAVPCEVCGAGLQADVASVVRMLRSRITNRKPGMRSRRPLSRSGCGIRHSALDIRRGD